MKCLFFYPPVGLYIRGEDRCQANVEESAAVSVRACNDLGYMASMLRTIGCDPVIADYPAERKNWDHFRNDLKLINPEFIVMTITTATLKKDMQAFNIAKEKNPDIITIANGAYFFSCDAATLEAPEFHAMDFAIFGEVESVINPLIQSISEGKPLSDVKGIIFRDKDTTKRYKTDKPKFIEDLDRIPFPARDLMNNRLYVRPDTGEMMATIQTSRGCPSDCIFCLSPLISGKSLRTRSPENVVNEIEECVKQHQINNFFFRADTFTLNRDWTINICKQIIKRNLNIKWVANSRTKPVNLEIFEWMKKAGCWLVALGIESGNDETLKKIKKGTTVDDNINAVRLAKKAGLKTYGFYLIGFPWETLKHFDDTLKLARKLDCNFSEIHLAAPYEGTELQRMARELGLSVQESSGFDYFTNPVSGTLFVSKEETLRFRDHALKVLYLNPSYILKTLRGIRSFKEFCNYGRRAILLMKNLF